MNKSVQSILSSSSKSKSGSAKRTKRGQGEHQEGNSGSQLHDGAVAGFELEKFSDDASGYQSGSGPGSAKKQFYNKDNISTNDNHPTN